MTDQLRAHSFGSSRRLVLALCSTVGIVFAVEALIMVLLSRLPAQSTWAEALIDSTLLSTLAFPLVYFLVVVPLAAGARKRELDNLKAARLVDDRLREAEAKYRHIFEHAVDGIYQAKPDGTFITVNNAMARLLGCTSPEELTSPWTNAEERAEFEGVLARDGAIYGWEYQVRRKDGSRRWASENARAIRNAEGVIEYYEGTVSDITDRKRVQQTLQDSERLLKETQAIAGLGSYVLDIPTGRWTSSAVLDDILGIDDQFDRSVGAWISLVDPKWRERMRTYLADGVLKTRRRFDMKYPIVRKRDGEPRWVHGLGELELDEQSRPLRMIGTIMDITERQQADEALRESEERLRLALDAAHMGTFDWDVPHNRIKWSRWHEELWGFGPGEFDGTYEAFFGRVHPDDGPGINAEVARCLGAHEPFAHEFRIVWPDGSVHWIAATGRFEFDASGQAVRMRGAVLQVTERKRGEDQLREQAELLDHAQDAIVVCDMEHRITYWNKSAERLYGWTAAEAIGRYVPDILYRQPALFHELRDMVILNGDWTGELQHLRRDGQDVAIESRWTLVRDRSGEPKSVLAINTDITERKKLEKQFLRAQRLESIGTLAGGIAHDLNNVLAPIMMSTDVLASKATDDDSRSLLETIAASAQRGADMVRQVLSFARGLEGRRVEVQVKHLIREMEKIARDTFPKNIRLRTTLAADLWTVLGDPTQLHQVLLNLCINARDAMPEGGELELAASNVAFDAQYASMNIDATAGPYVVIQVSDTGTGMPQAVVDRIFDPFFTTKEVGKGTGLGLSTSLTIVKGHGGFLRVWSEPGAGTRFRICLPAQTVGLDKTVGSPGVELARGEGETVLVVDDESSIREITRHALEAFGYRVLLASDGAEAVTLYAQHSSEIAVVLIDMVMPVMDGAAAIRVFVKMNPSIRIVAVSGIATTRESLPKIDSGTVLFLSKPYSTETLLLTLHQALGKDQLTAV